MEIKKIPIKTALTCSEKESVVEISKKLKDNKERRIFVVGADKKLIGIITTTDLVYKALSVPASNLTGKDVMTKEIKSVDITEDLNKALEIMNSLKTFTCPVTQKGVLLGVISYQELVSHVMTSVGG